MLIKDKINNKKCFLFGNSLSELFIQQLSAEQTDYFQSKVFCSGQ